MPQSDNFMFAIPGDQPILPIGTSFDVIEGQALSDEALPNLTATDLDIVAKKEQNCKYFFVKDASSFVEAFDFSVDAGGGGWGASYGVTASGGALIATSSLTQTVQFRGVRKEEQRLVRPSTALNPAAAAALAKGPDVFVENFGSHFIAGYVYGRTCNLSYNMAFSTLEAASRFNAAYGESVKELGFGSNMKVSIDNAMRLANSHCEFSVRASIQGFQAEAPQKLEDLDPIVKNFSGNSAPSDTPIFYIVAPWTYLSAVKSVSALKMDANVRQLARIFNRVTYIANSCRRALDASLYVGKTQYDATQDALYSASELMDEIVFLLKGCNGTGKALTSQQVRAIDAKAGVIIDKYAQTKRFKMAFWVKQGDPDQVALGPDLGPQRGSVDLSDVHHIHSDKGVWFDWSSNSNKVADILGESGGWIAGVFINLDSARGEASAYVSVNTWSPSASKPIKLTGSKAAPAFSPDNPFYVSFTQPGSDIRIGFCPA